MHPPTSTSLLINQFLALLLKNVFLKSIFIADRTIHKWNKWHDMALEYKAKFHWTMLLRKLLMNIINGGIYMYGFSKQICPYISLINFTLVWKVKGSKDRLTIGSLNVVWEVDLFNHHQDTCGFVCKLIEHLTSVNSLRARPLVLTVTQTGYYNCLWTHDVTLKMAGILSSVYDILLFCKQN